MALDGSEDHKIYHDLRPFWDELGMAKLREDSRIMHRSTVQLQQEQNINITAFHLTPQKTILFVRFFMTVQYSRACAV